MARAIQRYQIQVLYQQQLRQKDIASQVGVSAATINRELARNRSTDATQPYQATAQQATKYRRQRQAYKLKGSLKEAVLERLRQRFSPEQISGALALERGRNASVLKPFTAIVMLIMTRMNNHLLSSYAFATRNATRSGETLKSAPAGRCRSILHRVGIEERSAIVETNTQVGHWEGDTVMGAKHDGVLLTLVERVPKYTIIVKLPSKHALHLARQGVIHLQKCPLPVASITFDNGKEFTEHRLISQGVKAPVYFARPYHSWERGLNENTNGLLRHRTFASSRATVPIDS